ncbi:hypothetical protein HYW21_09005 [Candidatus Woesearchaeota archaeon]|nr:hypothetical protein [Candidatus Woesearchaeota archaeon]
MEATILSKIGLSEAESKIYLTVLKLGTVTVKEIAKESGFHRTNIYDVLDKLKEKGLMTFHKVGKTTKYKTADPENLFAYLKEKQLFLDSLMPDLRKLQELCIEDIEVEVYRGEEGMKSAWRDMIKEKKTLYGFGVRGQLREYLPEFAKQFLRDLKKHKIRYYGIYTRGERKPPWYYTEVRYVPHSMSSPVATFIYGNKVNINIWEPTLIAIVITSKGVAETYRKHFKLLWNIATK